LYEYVINFWKTPRVRFERLAFSPFSLIYLTVQLR
jgi:hypothetical protein